MSSELRLQVALQQLDRVLGFFPRVEGKASFLFAVNLSLLASALAFVGWKDVLGAVLVAVLLALVVVLCCASLVSLYFSYSPHLAPAGKSSLLYFADINRATSSDFATAWTAASSEEMLDDVLHQISRNSEILAKKFGATEAAFTLTAFAVIPWLLLFGLTAFARETFALGLTP